MEKESSIGKRILLIRNYFLVFSGRSCLVELWKDVSAWRASAWILLHWVPLPAPAPCLDPARSPVSADWSCRRITVCSKVCSAPQWAACLLPSLSELPPAVLVPGVRGRWGRPSWGMQLAGAAEMQNHQTVWPKEVTWRSPTLRLEPGPHLTVLTRPPS